MFPITNSFPIRRMMVLALLGVIACTSPTGPLHISNVTVFPEPRVGQIVEVQAELLSTYDEEEVVITVDSLEQGGSQVHLVSDQTEWREPLTANEPKIITFSVCVLKEGLWPIEIFAVSKRADGDIHSDSETTHFASTLESGYIILARNFSITQDERNAIPTARPFEVSPECSGE